MKYKYHCTCEPLSGEIVYYDSRRVYIDPYNALCAGVEKIMKMHVKHPYMINQGCRQVEVLDESDRLVMRLGTRYFVNNL